MKIRNSGLRYLGIVSFILLGLGLVLVVFMIQVESELGALPLLLIVLGTVGCVLFLVKSKNRGHDQS